MTQYIDKAALVAEIEKYISNYKEISNKVDKSSDDWVYSTLMLESKIDVLQHILSFLDTLETKEVDLEKEIHKFIDKEEQHKMKDSKPKDILLDKALDFIVETQEDNDYICEKMSELDEWEYCENNCQNLNKECVKRFLKHYENNQV